MDTRIGEHPDRTRFVIELSDPVRVRVFTLSGPNRIVVDMPEVLWRPGTAERPSGRGAVKSYRYGLFRPGDSRLIIDLSRPVRVAVPMILPPSGGFGYRMVLDLFPTTERSFDASAGWPTDLRVGSPAMPATRELSRTDVPPGKRVIVVDPGHGGIDTGTVGVNGEAEKDLVLDEGLRLRRELQRRGFAVHLTRDSDVYVPLRERADVARVYHADLFVSLHADSNPDPAVYGASVYTLSEAGSDREAAALARKENQSDAIAGIDLQGEASPVASILIGLAQRDTMNQSVQFARTAVAELEQATDVLVRDPHRSANFVVLKTPDVPAVLIELGYLSNPRDCAQMRTETWRAKVAMAIADAVERQFERDRPVAETSAQAAR